MTRSRDDLPAAIPSMWRLCKLAYRNEPALLLVAFGLAMLAALPDALLALWLKVLADGVLGQDRTRMLVAALGLGGSAAGTWLLRTVSTRVQRRFRDKVTIALESHVAGLQASVATIAHQERPEYLDRLPVLRDQVFVLDHLFMSLFTTAGWILRLAVTMVLLGSIHPALMLLMLFALPTVLTSTWRPAVERAAEERGAPAARLARHLFLTATTAAPGKEVRVTGIGPRLITDRRAAWQEWYGPIARTRVGSAIWHTLAWAVFGAGYVAAVVLVSTGLNASPGDVLLVLAAGARLSSYIGATVGEIGFLRGIWMDGSKRLAWLEDYAAALTARADQPVPARLHDGIVVENLTFAYPGTDRPVLQDVSLRLPAGKVVAVVGENGGGADDVVERLPDGLATQLGATWPGGVEMSFGQWQKLAVARGFMRDEPLLLVLDEPTAALDAETEHALFERYAAAAKKSAAQGRITVLVSHRFSTVRMADLIVVLDGARVVEAGSHAELVARGGQYAELFAIQAAA